MRLCTRRKGHKPWKKQNAVHAGVALLDAGGNLIDWCDYQKRDAPGIEWEANDCPSKPQRIHPIQHYEWMATRGGEGGPSAEVMMARDQAKRKADKRRAKQWAKKGDDEILTVKFHKLHPTVHFVLPIVSIRKQKYAWHLDRKKSVRKLKMRLLHGTKEGRYRRTGVPHDENGREGILEMDLNRLDQDVDSSASSSSDSSDSEGEDAGCESYIMGALVRKGAFWSCRCGGETAAGRCVQEVASGGVENLGLMLRVRVQLIGHARNNM